MNNKRGLWEQWIAKTVRQSDYGLDSAASYFIYDIVTLSRSGLQGRDSREDESGTEYPGRMRWASGPKDGWHTVRIHGYSPVCGPAQTARVTRLQRLPSSVLTATGVLCGNLPTFSP